MKGHLIKFTRIFVALVAASAIGVATSLSQSLHTVEAQSSYYQVAEDDTWSSIAAEHQTDVVKIWRSNGVTNPELLRSGQRLLIPDFRGALAVDTVTYQGSAASTTWSIAVRSGYPLITILQLNGLPSIVNAWSRVLNAPTTQVFIAAAAPQGPEAPAEARPTPIPTSNANSAPGGSEGALDPSLMGIQGHFSIPEDDVDKMLSLARRAGFKWVKYQVDWSVIEYVPGLYSVELDRLDTFMQRASAHNMRVLLSIAKAPDWARSTSDEDGPPTNFDEYNNFVRFIVLRYKYLIRGVEIWNEPNLRREWNGLSLSGAEYVQLLNGASQVIKTDYPEGDLVVISAGLAPTGVNDGVLAVSDREFLRQMYEAGIDDTVDAIGIHPYGWANPPNVRCCTYEGMAPSHTDHPTFYFLDTIEDYRDIQAAFGDDTRQLWATEFGWGTMDGLNLPVPDDAPFYAYLDQNLQAQYIRDAYLLAQSWDFMGPMFLWNLNVATLDGFDHNQAGYSILMGDAEARPAYNLLAETPKIGD